MSAAAAEIGADSQQMECTVTVSRVSMGPMRLSLRGSKALEVINTVFKPFTDGEDKAVSANVDRPDLSNEQFFGRASSHKPISRLWPEGAVLGLTVKDVRGPVLRSESGTGHIFNRANAFNASASSSHISGGKSVPNKLLWPADAARSSIWDAAQRSAIHSSFVPDNILNEVCHQYRQTVARDLFVGSEGEEDFNSDGIKADLAALESEGTRLTSSFPMLIVRKNLMNFSSTRLVRRMKSSRTPYVGFDLIVPAGWTAAVWRALQLAGARAIGVEEYESILLDHGMPAFPRDYPETPAGQNYWTVKESELVRIRAKKPPHKNRKEDYVFPLPRWNTLGNSVDVERIDQMMLTNMKSSSSDYRAIPSTAMGVSETHNITQCNDESRLAPYGMMPNFLVAREELYVDAFRVVSSIRSAAAQCSNFDLDDCTNEDLLACLLRTQKFEEGSTSEGDDVAHRMLILQLLASRDLPALPFATALHVLLVPASRGVPVDGTEIIAPSSADYQQWIYYHTRRSCASVSSTRNANKRIGEWRGCGPGPGVSGNTAIELTGMDVAGVGDETDEYTNNRVVGSSVSRKVIGMVTSGRYKGSPQGMPSLGLCDALLLIAMQSHAAQVATMNKLPPECSVMNIICLVLFRCPSSKLLRPGYIDVISAV
jgi:POPLD (NUC188) domain